MKIENDESKFLESLPKTQYDFFAGNYSFENSALEGHQSKWQKEYNIDGLEVRTAELLINKKLHELKAKRNTKGKLEIYDKGANKYVPFSTQRFAQLADIAIYSFPKINNKKSLMAFSPVMGGGRAAAQYFCKNLLDKGILRLDDFPILGDATKGAIFGSKERQFKKGLNEFVMTGEAGAAMYYIGRDKIKDTDVQINPETMSIIQLDVNTFAIVEKSAVGKNEEAKKNILYTFSAVTKEERDDLIKKILVDKGTKYRNEKDIPVYDIRVPMEGRIQKYTDESNTDVNFIVNTVRNLTAEYSIPILKLSWEEQTQIASMISTLPRDRKDKFELFLKNFNLSGLRTFLSLAHGGKEMGMGDKILNLGLEEKIPREVLDSIFNKYSDIVNIAHDANKVLKDILPKEVFENSSNEIEEIRESLLIRAQKLLLTFHDNKDLNSEELLKNLERYKAEVFLYADTYKKLKQSGSVISLETIKNTKMKILSQEEKEERASKLWDITKANRPFIVDQEEIEKRKKVFYDTINNPDSIFYDLTYKHKDNKEDSDIAFCSVTSDENGDLYVESLNIESEIKGSQIGSEFFPMVIEELKKKGKNIYGHVHPGNSGTLLYYTRLGFTISPIEEDGKLKYYEIRIKARQEEQELKMAA